ncbi:MAG TPA: hypothetical protein VIM75_09755 [Ohtaekwangia sp.]|uniref:hypothetical protein n=1 Tax=Ohtaekwangia sp. TaxID=2066019 RepID=UPI002F94C252
MKKYIKYLSTCGLIIIFTLCLTQPAEAKFWGKEIGEIVAYQDGTICQTVTTYRLWIKVSTQTTCGPCCQ